MYVIRNQHLSPCHHHQASVQAFLLSLHHRLTGWLTDWMNGGCPYRRDAQSKTCNHYNLLLSIYSSCGLGWLCVRLLPLLLLLVQSSPYGSWRLWSLWDKTVHILPKVLPVFIASIMNGLTDKWTGKHLRLEQYWKVRIVVCFLD